MSAPETFVHSQLVREARRRRHLSAPTAGSCRQTCYCKTLRRELGKGRRRRRRVEGFSASPTGQGAPGVPAEHPRGWGPLPVPGLGLPEGSGHLVPINGVWLGAAQRLPSNPGSAFARHGGTGIFGAGGGFGASLPKEVAGWQRVLVRGRGSQAAGLLPPRCVTRGRRVPEQLVRITQHPGCFLHKLYLSGPWVVTCGLDLGILMEVMALLPKKACLCL